MKLFWFIIFYTVIFGILGWGFEIISTQVHESVHVAIFNNYNISSTVRINWLTADGATQPDSGEYRLYCNEQCKFSHSLNEIVGYNVNIIVFSIMLGIYFAGILLMLLFKLKEFEFDESLTKQSLDEIKSELKKMKNDGGELPFAELSDLTGETLI